jgi:hypothetical protein
VIDLLLGLYPRYLSLHVVGIRIWLLLNFLLRDFRVPSIRSLQALKFLYVAEPHTNSQRRDCPSVPRSLSHCIGFHTTPTTRSVSILPRYVPRHRHLFSTIVGPFNVASFPLSTRKRCPVCDGTSPCLTHGSPGAAAINNVTRVMLFVISQQVAHGPWVLSRRSFSFSQCLVVVFSSFSV